MQSESLQHCCWAPRDISGKNPMNALFLKTVGIVFCFVCVGCSVPLASPELIQQAESFSPPQGKSNLYVIRPYRYTASAARFDVSLDFSGIGSVSTSSYLYAPIDPGDHFLGAQVGMGTSGRHKFTAVAGNNYFFEVTPGFLDIDIDQMSEEDGRESVLNKKASGENIYDIK